MKHRPIYSQLEREIQTRKRISELPLLAIIFLLMIVAGSIETWGQ